MKNLELYSVENLSEKELKNTEGGFLVLAIWAAAGMVAYGAGYAYGKLTCECEE